MEETNKTRILVVDDEEDLCEILKFNLETEGYDVETAGSGEQALDMHPETFSLILLDVMMGGMSGFTVARKASQPGTNERHTCNFSHGKGNGER